MRNDFIYLDFESDVPPAISECETACAEFESNPRFIHDNPVDISRRKYSCTHYGYLDFFFFLFTVFTLSSVCS